jgi:hypothetical protein
MRIKYSDHATHCGIHLRAIVQLATEGLPQLLLRLGQQKLTLLGQPGWAGPYLHPGEPAAAGPSLLRRNATEGWRSVSQHKKSGHPITYSGGAAATFWSRRERLVECACAGMTKRCVVYMRGVG